MTGYGIALFPQHAEMLEASGNPAIHTVAPPVRARVDVAAVMGHIDHFQHRVIQDAVAEATASCWMRRAETLESARPRRGDFHGNATREALQARWDRLTEQSEACRAAAEVALIQDGAS